MSGSAGKLTVMLLYSHTRIGTEHGLRQVFAYGRPWVTEKPIWPHCVSYQFGPAMFQRLSSPERPPTWAMAGMANAVNAMTAISFFIANKTLGPAILVRVLWPLVPPIHTTHRQ